MLHNPTYIFLEWLTSIKITLVSQLFIMTKESSQKHYHHSRAPWWVNKPGVESHPWRRHFAQLRKWEKANRQVSHPRGKAAMTDSSWRGIDTSELWSKHKGITPRGTFSQHRPICKVDLLRDTGFVLNIPQFVLYTGQSRPHGLVCRFKSAMGLVTNVHKL